MTKLEDIREIVAKRAPGETFHSVAKMCDAHVVELFNGLLEGKPYWFCPDCEEFHSREQLHCSLPCTVNDVEQATTEEEYEQLYDKFDPASYEEDEDHLQFPHTKFASWMNNSQTIYNRKINHHAGQKLEQAAIAWKCKHDGRLAININDYRTQVILSIPVPDRTDLKAQVITGLRDKGFPTPNFELRRYGRGWKLGNYELRQEQGTVNVYGPAMNRFELALRKFEIKRFNGWLQTGAAKTLDTLCEWSIQTAPK